MRRNALYSPPMGIILYLRASERTPSIRKEAGFLRGARAHNWSVHSVCASPEEPPDVAKLIGFWKPQGIAIDCGGFGDLPPEEAFLGTPAVFISMSPERRDKALSVGEDVRATSEAAARELLNLGYPNYAFVNSRLPRYWSQSRSQNFRDAILLNKRAFFEFPSHGELATLAWTRLLKQWLKKLPVPCGIFAANDGVADLIRSICTVERIAVPSKIAILGVDNDEPLCSKSSPSLSSVLCDNEQMGFIAASLLSQRIKNAKLKPVHLTVPPLMVVRRDSTRKSAGHGDRQTLDAVKLIRERACEGLAARDVLKVFSCGRRTAETRFRDATGHSILEEIQIVRMDRARELVNDRTMPVKVIANLCGYASETAFRKVYRERFGAQPRRSPSHRA